MLRSLRGSITLPRDVSDQTLITQARTEKDGIRVFSYWTETPPEDLLQKKLHEAVAIARANLERLFKF